MAWIEVHQALRDHRKVLALATELELPEPHVVGHVVYLWLWALDNAQDGRLPASPRIIERAAGWTGAAGAFVAALLATDMLDQDDAGDLFIHDWNEYAGRLIEKRRANADRMRSARAHTDTPPPDPATRTVPARATHVQRTYDARAGATVPNLNRTHTEHPTDDAAVASAARAATGSNVLVLPVGNAYHLHAAEGVDAILAPLDTPVTGPMAQAASPPERLLASPPVKGALPPRDAGEQELAYWLRVVRAETNASRRLALCVRLAGEKLAVDTTAGGAAYARIGALAKALGAGQLVHDIFKAASEHIDGEPLDYLTKLAHSRKETNTKGTHSYGASGPAATRSTREPPNPSANGKYARRITQG